MGGKRLDQCFADCAVLVRDTISPDACRGKRYIGLEHIEEGSLRLLDIGRGESVTSQKSAFRAGDILFGKLRPYFRKVVRPRFDGVCSTDIWVVRATKDIDQGFLYYWMASKEFVDAATRGSTGTKMPRANWDFVGRESLPIPPLPIQRRIASILGSLDDKIELNRRMNRTLERMAQALFKSWFIDFDPACAKAAGRDPGLPAPLAALFPDAFEDSPLGQIPKGWVAGKVKDCCEKVQNGGTPKRDMASYWTPTVIPWLTSGEVRQAIAIKTDNFISELGLDKSSAKWVSAGSTAVALYGATAGQVCLIAEPMTTNQAVCALIPKPNCRYFNYLMLTSLVSSLAHQASGSAQQNISKGLVEQAAVVLPTDSILQEFETLSTPLFRKWIANLRCNNILCLTRDTLLPKLLSGELEVPEAEGLVEEVVG